MNSSLTRFRAEVALDLMTLVQLHDRELTPDMLRALKKVGFPHCFALKLTGNAAAEAMLVLESAIADLDNDQAQFDELAADYASIYLTHAYVAAPCESVWLDDDGLVMQEPMFEVRKFYAQFGFRAPDWRLRADDHLVHQIQFLAELLDPREPSGLVESARFLDEHTLRWVPDFARRVAARAQTPLYAGVALLTVAMLDELRDVLAEVNGEPRPTAEEIEQRAQLAARQRQEEVAVPMPDRYVPGTAPSW